jgi:uncharacterized membrane protein YphA (DoxX/SURF4 family)
MQRSRSQHSVGTFVYAAGAIFLGLLGLVSGDFAVTWQHVSTNLPFRQPLAYLTAVVELAAGLCLLWRRTALVGALVLTALYAVFTAVWIPAYAHSLSNFDPLGNVFEEFSLVVAGAVLFASTLPPGSFVSRLEPNLARLYAFSAISFGIGHIFYMPGMLSWIPKWLPPSQMFWAYVTTIGFFLAAIAIVSGVMAPLAARLVTAEIFAFEIFVWIPKLAAGPREHRNWAGNAINIALMGAAWVVADSIGHTARQAANHPDPGR